MEYEEITGIKAVNSDKEMIIAVQIKHMKRFFLAKHRKAWQKEMEKQFPGWKVELSTDKKIYLELDKLEEKINNDTLLKDEFKKEEKRPIVQNCMKAFLVGGTICFIGQIIMTFYIHFFPFTEQTAGNPTTATLIFLTMLATGFGYYDRLGQFAGAGSAVPVTGF